MVALCLAGTALGSDSPDTNLRWEGCGISKYSFMEGLAAEYKDQVGTQIELAGGGATHGIWAVGAGTIDLGGSCRHALEFPEEKSSILIPVAWDALVVVVHPDNPIQGISRQQLAKVFSGQLTTWRELGVSGEFGPVHVYAREGKLSGVGYMSRIMLFSNPEQEFSATHFFRSSGPLETTLEQDTSGLALTGISSARRRDLKIIELDGVKPSRASIMAGDYEFARPLFLVVPLDFKKKPAILDFVRWARSDRGQSAIRNTGAVPVIDITPQTWEDYSHVMSQANQDLSALQRILADLAADELGD